MKYEVKWRTPHVCLEGRDYCRTIKKWWKYIGHHGIIKVLGFQNEEKRPEQRGIIFQRNLITEKDVMSPLADPIVEKIYKDELTAGLAADSY